MAFARNEVVDMAKSAGTFLRRWGIWILALLPATWLWVIVSLSLKIASRRVRTTQDSIAQMDLIIAASGIVFASAVAGATIYYAKRTGDMVKLMNRQAVEQRRSKREDAVHAFLGSVMASAGFAGNLAEVQRYGTRGDRKLAREGPALRELRIEGWKQLSTSVTHVAIAMERIRLSAPDLVESAGPVFDSVLEAQTCAAEGDAKGLIGQADDIRERANALREALG